MPWRSCASGIRGTRTNNRGPVPPSAATVVLVQVALVLLTNRFMPRRFHNCPATRELEQLRAALSSRYLVERELAAGGMAKVYVAHDIKHDRDVAVKLLNPELSQSLGGDRFLTEIRTTARLQHQHILPLLDSRIRSERTCGW
jgi:hypothetical protein